MLLPDKTTGQDILSAHERGIITREEVRWALGFKSATARKPSAEEVEYKRKYEEYLLMNLQLCHALDAACLMLSRGDARILAARGPAEWREGFMQQARKVGCNDGHADS